MIQHFHSGHALKRTESWISKRYLCTHFHSSVTHNSWNPGATNVSVNGWIEKQKCGIYIQRSATAVYTTAAYYSGLLQRYIHTVVYTYSGIYYSGLLQQYILQRSATAVCYSGILQQYIHTAVYYSGIYIQWYATAVYYSRLLQRSATAVCYSGLLCSPEKEQNSEHALTWMDLEDILLGAISQSQKDRYCRVPLTWAKITETEDRMWLPGAGMGDLGRWCLKRVEFQFGNL